MGVNSTLTLLSIKVAVLSDQIESANDKIGDMEKLLEDKKEVLRKTEDLLQREVLARSSLETQKLELMSQLTNFKLRQTNLDQENMDLRKRLAKTLDLSTVATAALAAATSNHVDDKSNKRMLQNSEAMLKKNFDENCQTYTRIQGI